MSEPLIAAEDLGTYLNDPAIDEERADFLIAQAQTLCESIITPLPVTAAVVVTRVAGRAYVTITSPRQQQLAQAGSPYSAQPGGTGAVRLMKEDVADLRRLGSSGGAFSIDTLPADYAVIVPWWDANIDPGWRA